MASISGSVTIAGDPDDWIAVAWDADTHAYAGVATVSGGAYTISGLTAGKAYVVGCRPKSGGAWASATVMASGSYAIPSNPVNIPYLFKASVSTLADPEFNSVSLLLPMDGVNGSNTFTDKSISPKTITANGNVQISTAQSKFGGASCLFDGNGDYLQVPANSAFVFGTDNFTIEFWMFASQTAPSYSGVIHVDRLTGDTNGQFTIYNAFSNNRIMNMDFYYNGWAGVGVAANAYPANTWTHFAFVRNGNTLSCYMNGVSQSSANVSGKTFGISGRNLYIGYNNKDAAYFNGYLDDIRITKGVARYTDSFSPPESAFSTIAPLKTGATEPEWNNVVGADTTDNGTLWTNMGQFVRPLMQGPLIAA